MNRSVLAAAAAFVFIAAPASAPAEDAGASWDSAMAAVLAGDHRGSNRGGVPNSSRDGARNPAATLKFLGLQPDSSVVEIWPAGGWYTEIIAPFVAGNGQFYGAQFPGGTDMEFFNRARDAYQAKLDANPQAYGNAQMTEMYPGSMALAPEPVDMVLTFRNVHNWMSRDMQDEVMQAFYDVLKPGGVLGIVEHRATPGSEQDPKAESGYVTEEYTIMLAEKAGFVLDAKSEINANPRDTRDHPEGVWTLPPTLRLGDEDREKYVEIGESDRYTLRFRKPE